jgi:hypothetical protein
MSTVCLADLPITGRSRCRSSGAGGCGRPR